MEQLQKIIDETALKLVMADAGDLRGLAEIHSRFEQVAQYTQQSEIASPEHLDLVKSVSVKAAELVEKIILQETSDVTGAIHAIGETTKSLQSLIGKIADGQDPSDVVFPEMLALNTATKDTPDENQAFSLGKVTFDLPANVDEEIFLEFLSSQPHVLENLETTILTAEQNPSEENRSAIKAILHNFKGEASLMGLEELAGVCHESESLLQDPQAKFPAEKLLAAKDWLNKAILSLRGEPTDQDSDSENPESPPGTASESDADKQPEQEDLTIAEGDVPLVIDFINESGEHLESAEADLLTVEEKPDDSEAINSIFRAFHTIKGVAGFLNLKQIGLLAHAAENLLDMARKGDLVLSGTYIDVVFESMDVMKQMLSGLNGAVEKSEPVPSYGNLPALIDRIKNCATGKAPPPKLGQVLVQQGVVEAETVRQVLNEQRTGNTDKKIGDILLENKSVSEEQIQTALQEQKTSQKNRPQETKKFSTESTVKVTTGRLDSLINMVGELVIAQLMVSRDLAETAGTNQRLGRNVRHMDKITRELQELSMSMRMVPVHGVFQKMARLVRDLSRKADKNIDFVMTGAETELDRNVVEAIADPLVHMVRNSVDHGIESPDQRRQAGKKPNGKLELKAFHQGGNIVIEITDDGKGLDRDKILQKAITNGIVKEGQELSDGEIYRLVFHAGLSTAEKITSISGRGVGMDVVRKNIESLRGRIDIDSKRGRGSTFSIRLPLTLAVIDGQIVTVGKEVFIIPTVAIEQSLRPCREQLTTVQGQKAEVLKIRNDLLPLIRLHRLFDIEPEHTDPCESLIVVVLDGENRCALQVDSLMGQQQVVIKSIGEYIGNIKGVSGAAIMGDGNVSLILDVPGLISMATKDK